MDRDITSLLWLLCTRGPMAEAEREADDTNPYGLYADLDNLWPEYPNRLEMVAIAEDIENSAN